MLRIAELLLHDDDVPIEARQALASALSGPEDERCDNLREAAVILHRETPLDREEVRDLIGLHDCECSAT